MTQKRRITADRMRLWFPTEAASARLIYPYDDRDRVGPALVCTLDEIVLKSLGNEGKNTRLRVAGRILRRLFPWKYWMNVLFDLESGHECGVPARTGGRREVSRFRSFRPVRRVR